MTSSALAVPQALEALPETCPGVHAWIVAYSGGVDSTALLHAMRAFAGSIWYPRRSPKAGVLSAASRNGP